MGLRKSYFVLWVSTSLGLYNVRGSVHSKTEFLFVCWFLFGLGLGFLGVLLLSWVFLELSVGVTWLISSASVSLTRFLLHLCLDTHLIFSFGIKFYIQFTRVLVSELLLICCC